MVATIFVLCLALIGVVFYLTHALKKAHTQNIETEDMKNARLRAAKMIDEANSNALDIINKANLSAGASSESFNQEIIRIASTQIKEFEKTTSEFTKLYSQILSDLKTKNIEVFQNVSKDIETNTIEEIKNFRNSVEKLTVSSQKLVKKKIDTDFAQVQKEIENYKAEELKKIDDKIYSLLEKVSKFTLGRAINLSEHENLIIKALDRAKKEGLFAK